MSASREKKLRQDSGPSARQAQAQKEAAAYKKKAITYTVIGVVIAVLIAALLIWNSGVFQRGTPAASVGNTKYSINEVSYFYQQAKYNANYIYYYYGLSQYIPADSDAQDESGKTWREYYLEQSVDSMVEFTALYDAAVKAGCKESDVTATVNDQIADAKAAASSNGYSYDSYLKLMYGKFMSAGDFKKIVTKQAVANKYYTDHYNALTYSDEQIGAYYDENKNSLDTFEYSYLYFTPKAVDTKDADGNEISEDKQKELKGLALAEAKTKADDALAAIKGGKSIEDAVKEYEPSSSGDHTSALGSSLSTIYNEKLFSMKDGDCDVVENGESGYYVVQLHKRSRVEDATVDTRHILITAEADSKLDAATSDSSSESIPSQKSWDAAKAKAEQVLAEYNKGAKTEDAFAALANKYSDDGGSNTKGGLYEGVYKGQFVTEYDKWLFEQTHAAGDVELIQHPNDGTTSNYYGYHIVYYAGQNDPVWKLSCISALRDKDAQQWLKDLQNGYSGKLESGADYVGK